MTLVFFYSDVIKSSVFPFSIHFPLLIVRDPIPPMHLVFQCEVFTSSNFKF
jgi:hypothetical protein